MTDFVYIHPIFNDYSEFALDPNAGPPRLGPYYCDDVPTGTLNKDGSLDVACPDGYGQGCHYVTIPLEVLERIVVAARTLKEHHETP